MLGVYLDIIFIHLRLARQNPGSSSRLSRTTAKELRNRTGRKTFQFSCDFFWMETQPKNRRKQTWAMQSDYGWLSIWPRSQLCSSLEFSQQRRVDKMEILNWILILAMLVCFLVMLYATIDTLETSKIFRDFVARRIEEESRSSFEKKNSNDTNTNIKTWL